MATANPTATTPGYVAGTWAIDPIHSDVSFTVRHMMVSKVRGRFSKFEGTIRMGDAATYPTMSYRSLRVRPSGDGYVVEGEAILQP